MEQSVKDVESSLQLLRTYVECGPQLPSKQEQEVNTRGGREQDDVVEAG